MSRARLVARAFVGSALLAAGPGAPLAAQEPPADVAWEVQALAPGVTVVQAREAVGGFLQANVVVVEGVEGGDELLLLDSGLEQAAPSLGRLLEERTGFARATAVWNTHADLDHSGANALLADSAGTLPPAGAVVHRVFGGIDVEVMGFGRVHSARDVGYHLADPDVMVVGDLLPDGYPALRQAPGGVEALDNALRRILARATPETRIVPGHGPVLGRADVLAFRAMLRAVRDAVADALTRGASEDEVVAAAPSRRWDDRWRGVLDGEAWVRQLYRIMAAGR